MKEFTIGKNDAGQRLDRFLSKTMPLLPPALLQKYIRRAIELFKASSVQLESINIVLNIGKDGDDAENCIRMICNEYRHHNLSIQDGFNMIDEVSFKRTLHIVDAFYSEDKASFI